MQEITEHYRNDRLSELLKSQIVGVESDELGKRFKEQQLAALNRASERAADGDRAVISIKTSRNIKFTDDCPCGSGNTFRVCCGKNMPQGDGRIG